MNAIYNVASQSYDSTSGVKDACNKLYFVMVESMMYSGDPLWGTSESK